MRIATLALSAALVLWSGAALAADAMANTYGNTVTAKSVKTGMTSKFYFNQDGTYSVDAPGADGKVVGAKGTWSTKDDGKTLCLSPTAAADGGSPPPPVCSPVDMHGVGDTWSLTNSQGENYEVSIIAGR